MNMNLSDLLTNAGFDLNRVKLLRHDHRGTAAYQLSRDHFGSFLSIQRTRTSPYRSDPEIAVHFLKGPTLENGSSTAVYIGATRLLGRRDWGAGALPKLWLPGDYDGGFKKPEHENEASDHEWLDFLSDKVENLIIDWGHGARAWHQWAHNSIKPILSSLDGLSDATKMPRMFQNALSEAAKQKAMRDHEESEIERALSKNPEAVERSFAECIREQRPQQSNFRRLLFRQYGSACAFTGPAPDAVLEAAHIVPFADGHSWRDMPSNGLLLRRDVHRLFDLLLISVDPETKCVWISPDLDGTRYEELRDTEVELSCSMIALKEHFSRTAG